MNSFNIKNQGGQVNLEILDFIGNGGVEAKAVIDALKPFKGQPLHITINSDGGDVFQGISIYNTIKLNHPDSTTEIIGLGASIASIIFLAGKTRIMNDGTFLMIHNPWVGAV